MSSITQREYWLDKVEAEIVAKTPQITDADRKQSISRLGLTSLLAKKEKLDNQHRDLETEIRKVEEDICRALDIPTGMRWGLSDRIDNAIRKDSQQHRKRDEVLEELCALRNKVMLASKPADYKAIETDLLKIGGAV